MANIVDNIFLSRNLNNIQRYSLVRTNKSQSVAEHSYNVSILASLVYKSLLFYFNSKIEDSNILAIGELYVLKSSLYHDLGESVTGDIVYTFKNSEFFENSGERDYILECFTSSCFADELPLLLDFSNTPEEVNSRLKYFCGLFADPSTIDQELYKEFVNELDLIIKFCDYLELLFYTFEEIKSGNSLIRPISKSGLGIITNSKFDFIYANSDIVRFIVKELAEGLAQ